MIQHIVLFTLRDGVCADDERVAEALQASRRLAGLPQARRWLVEANLSDRDIAADFAAVGDFDDAQGLAEFLRHPDHVSAGARWGELATWTIADFPLPRES
jgi:hypothetical protein